MAMKIGSMDIQGIETGIFKLDGGAMFGVVPKTLWSKTNPPDELNRIALALRVLLVRTGDRNILVDTGAGSKLSDKIIQMYGIESQQSQLELNLERAGCPAEKITDVIVTHLHFDHAGGSTKKLGNEIVCTFPNARYYIQKAQWDWGQHPSERDRASYFPENYLPIREQEKLTVIDGDEEVYPGIFLLKLDGHTFGNQLVKIRSDDETILFCGDLIPTTAHVPGPYIMGYDLQPMKTLEEKNRLLDQAAQENWTLFLEHDPVDACAKVEKVEKRFRVTRKGSLAEISSAHS